MFITNIKIEKSIPPAKKAPSTIATDTETGSAIMDRDSDDVEKGFLAGDHIN